MPDAQRCVQSRHYGGLGPSLSIQLLRLVPPHALVDQTLGMQQPTMHFDYYGGQWVLDTKATGPILCWIFPHKSAKSS
jgi:hypothetical protein